MPQLKYKKPELSLTLAQLRVLRAVGGGAATLGRIGGRAGKAGAADGATCRALEALGLLRREVLDIDGLKEQAWMRTDAGNAALEAADGKGALPQLEARRERGKELKVGALVPLFGSNRLLAPAVGQALTGCQWVGVPFMGSLAELPFIEARTVVANDAHEALVNLAMTAADPLLGVRLWKGLRRMPFHEAALREAQAFCMSMEEQAEPKEMPDLRWATNYFLCAWTARNGEAGKAKEFGAPLSIRWNAGGGDSCVRLRNASKALTDWRRILARCTFVTMDAFDFLDKCKDAAGHGVYCDPPFPGPGDAYKHRFSEAQQRRLAKVLGAYKLSRVVCRFYDVPLIRELYREADGWTWLRFAGRKQTNAAAPEVLLVLNGNEEACQS